MFYLSTCILILLEAVGEKVSIKAGDGVPFVGVFWGF